jgi:hypothetical protein
VLWASDHGLLHVTIFDRYHPSLALLGGDETGTALESAMWHSRLLAPIEYDGDAVTH